jgi:hypothetical protein
MSLRALAALPRIVGALACFAAGVGGLIDWLLGSGGAAEDFAASAWISAGFVLALLAGICIPAIARIGNPSASLRFTQTAATGLFALFVLITVNSLGAWLLPSAALGILVWLLSRKTLLQVPAR